MGKRILIIAALAFGAMSLPHTQSLARGDSSPTEEYSKYNLPTYVAAEQAEFDLAAGMQHGEFAQLEAVETAEAKAEPVRKFTGVASLVQLRSWRAITQGHYWAEDVGYKQTVMILSKEKHNRIRWKDLHRRSC